MSGIDLTIQSVFDTRKYAIQSVIDDFWLENRADADAMVYSTISTMMTKGALAVWADIYKAGKPVVVDYHLEELERLDGFGVPQRLYRLHYRLTVVQSHRISIPVFEYTDAKGITFWKCIYCGLSNEQHATYCGEKHHHAVGCGAPKDGLTSHEKGGNLVRH